MKQIRFLFLSLSLLSMKMYFYIFSCIFIFKFLESIIDWLIDWFSICPLLDPRELLPAGCFNTLLLFFDMKCSSWISFHSWDHVSLPLATHSSFPSFLSQQHLNLSRPATTFWTVSFNKFKTLYCFPRSPSNLCLPHQWHWEKSLQIQTRS